MKKFKVWVERSDITKEFLTVEAESLEDALDKASGGEIEPDASEHIYGEVLDCGEIEEDEEEVKFTGFTYPDPDKVQS